MVLKLVSPEDILRGQILIAGKAFSIDSKKPLSQIQGDLETFMLAQKIVENKRNENLFTRMLTSLLGVPSAEAAIPLLVVAVILLIGTIGVGFWLKSKEAQLRAVKEALRQAHRDITQKAEACERGNSESASYDTTFDLMASILAKKHENTAAGAFYSTMLQPTPEGTSPVQDCRTMVESFIERTFSRLAGTASEGSQLGELRTQLCGGSTPQQMMLGDSEMVGSYVRLRNCLSEFHRTHQSITDGNRNSVWMDGDTGLVRNRGYYYNNSLAVGGV